MKKLNVMIYAETLEALCELPNEDLGAIVKHINDWNNDKEVVIENPFHKSFWKMILPDLERNKENYLTTLENRQRVGRENGKLGGRPKKDKETQENLMGFSGNLNNPNCNYNSNNTSKEVLSREEGIGKQETLNGVSVSGEEVSKGLEKLEDIFPSRKRDIGIDEINLWNSLSQNQKANLIKSASSYIRTESKNEDGKWIKKLSKWIRDEISKGVKEELRPVAKSNSKKTYKYEDGNIIGILQDKMGSSTLATYAFDYLNTAGFTKEEFRDIVETTDKEDLLQMIR